MPAKRKLPRRDRCFLVGKRALQLRRRQAATAWYALAGQLVELGDSDIPKYKNVIRAIRKATILGVGKRLTTSLPPS